MKYFLFFLCLLLCTAPVIAQADDEVMAEDEQALEKVQVAPPDARIELRPFDQERIEKLRTEYNYDHDLRLEPTFWERFKELVGRWFEAIFGKVAGAFLTAELFYVLIVLIIVFALVMLSRSSLYRVFHGAPRSMGDVVVSEEDIREMDLHQLIAEAERSGDLRRAIRLHYLLVLRKLVDQGTLLWHPHNTDEDYMAQIKDPVLRSRFAHVVLVFQWVWYGNAEVAPAKYQDLSRPFIQFETSEAA